MFCDKVMDRCFTGTSSRIKGAGFEAIYDDMTELHRLAYPPHIDTIPMLRNPGQFHFRNGGEAHLNTPEGKIHVMLYLKYKRSLQWSHFLLYIYLCTLVYC
jgi:glutamate synthase domain-containing protein 2